MGVMSVGRRMLLMECSFAVNDMSHASSSASEKTRKRAPEVPSVITAELRKPILIHILYDHILYDGLQPNYIVRI